MLKKELTNVLKEIKENKYDFKDLDKHNLVNLLLMNIGEKDNTLRDDYIYPTLAHLLHDKHFNEEELTQYLYVLLDENHLRYDMENKDELSVLTRSFSILQLVILVFVHKRDNIIKEKDIKHSFDVFLDYYKKEQILQGYHDEYGWVHCIAHSADLFHQYAEVECLLESELKNVLEEIKTKFKQSDHYYSHDEDERTVKAVRTILNRDILSDSYLYEYFEDFSVYDKNIPFPQRYFITNNIKGFLRSMYFNLLDVKEYKELTKHIKDLLSKNVTLR